MPGAKLRLFHYILLFIKYHNVFKIAKNHNPPQLMRYRISYGDHDLLYSMSYRIPIIYDRFPTASAHCSRACLIIMRGLATFKRMNPSPPGPNISPSFSAR